MYKITVRSWVLEEESPDTAPGIWKEVEKIYFLTARQVEEFAALHSEFAIETVKWYDVLDEKERSTQTQLQPRIEEQGLL